MGSRIPPTVASHHATTSITTVTIDHRRPEFTADASPNLTVFCRVNVLSAIPSQMASLDG